MNIKTLYQGKKRLAKRRIGGRYYQELLLWALSIEPGDYIATCEGVNRKVAEVKPCWANEGKWRRGKKNKTWFLNEVRFTDTRGRWHHCPGGGCAYPKETPEEITAYLKAVAQDVVDAHERDEPGWYSEAQLESFRAILRALEEGEAVVDEFGEYLPRFDYR